MRIAYLLGSLNRGGTETLLLDVLRNSKQNQLDAIGIYRKTGVLEADFQSSGIPVKKLAVGKNPLNYLWRLRNQLKREGADIVHAQQFLDAFYARLACARLKIKVIQTFHGYDYNNRKLDACLLKWVIRRTDCNLYVSREVCRYYSSKYHLNDKKQTVVYNGVSFDKFSNEKQLVLVDWRKSLSLPATTLLLGTVGNFVPGRDQLAICRFLKLLKEQSVDFHFLFAGKKSEGQPELYDLCVDFCRENGLEQQVSFLGSRDDVPKLLPQLDAFIYSTDHDTFGIAVVEAMATGIPVFVNDWPVMSEITHNGQHATLYQTKDEQDLLTKFMLFLQQRESYQTKAREASAFVREHYSIERHIEELKRVYLSIENS